MGHGAGRKRITIYDLRIEEGLTGIRRNTDLYYVLPQGRMNTLECDIRFIHIKRSIAHEI